MIIDEDDEDDYDARFREAAEYVYDKEKRRLTFTDEKSDKFWHVNRVGAAYYVHYGRNGTFGRIDIKETDDDAECENTVRKTTQEKLKKGYAEQAPSPSDCFEAHKQAAREVLDSMYFMFRDDEDVPLIYIEAVKAACDRFCDLLRDAAEDPAQIMLCVKTLVLALNLLTEETGIIETDEREMLYDFIMGGVKLAGMETDEDITEEWRDW